MDKKIKKFGEKSDDKQTVFAVSFESNKSGEKGVLKIFNSLKNAEKFIRQSVENDGKYGEDIRYTISQHDVDG